jgi:glycerol-3-phosphate dehydrogenase
LCLKLLITITGGKWTTYRKIAEDIDKAITVRNLPKRECKTENISIHGNIKSKQVDRKTICIYTEPTFLKY